MTQLRFPRTLFQATGAIGAVLVTLLGVQVPAFAQSSATNHLFPEMHTSTVANVTGQNGDANPYGITIVPYSSGNLVAGDILVADFNNQAGTTGAGTTIMQVNPNTGRSSVFFQSSQITGPVGIAVNAVNDIVWVAYYGSQANGSEGGYAVIKPNGQLAANFTNANTGTKPSQFFEGVWGADFAKELSFGQMSA